MLADSSIRKLPKAVWFALAAWLGHLFGVDQVTGSPVALNETPGTRNVNCVPRIAETIVLEAHSRLVARWFRIAFDDDTM